MDLGKIQQFNYPVNTLYQNKKEDTKHISMPKNIHNTYFRGAYDKYSDKNIILNPTFSKSDITKLAHNSTITFKSLSKQQNLKDRKKRNNELGYKELSDTEFKRIKPQVEKKLVNMDKDLSKNLNKHNILITDKILSNEKYYNNPNIMNKLSNIIYFTDTSDKNMIANTIFSNKELYDDKKIMEEADSIISSITTPEKARFAKRILTDKRLYRNPNIIKYATTSINSIKNLEQSKIKSNMLDKILSDEKLYNNKNVMNEITDIIISINNTEKFKVKSDLIEKILLDKKLYSNKSFMNNAGNIIASTNNSQQAKIADRILSDERLFNNENFMNQAGDIIKYTYTPEQAKIKSDMIDKILSNERLFNNENFMSTAGDIIEYTYTLEQAKSKSDIIDKILSDEKLFNNENFISKAGNIIKNTYTPEQVNWINKIFSDEKLFNNENFMDNVGNIIFQVDKTKLDYADNLIKQFKENELTAEQISILLKNYGEISYKDIQKLKNTIGREQVNKMNETDLLVAAQFPLLAGKQNINEIPIEEKRGILRNLVANNTGLFEISDDLAKDFPLIPRNQEQYCKLLPAIVRSLGVDITPLKPDTKVENFNNSMSNLSKSLAKLSDNDFANISITQEYSKDDFIKTVLSKVKDLSREERQKVYDYYGFELHHNKANKETGFSITGYPVNLNNGKKLAQITDPKTKEVVENLRSDVIRFSENNRIKSNNPEVEKFLNEIIDALPELRTTIGKGQHSTHDFDIMQHSLKVMQKVTQDPKFNELNESDKKIMMLASLMHDIRKREGFSDPTHADESSFDTFFIGKKFNLSKDEEIKLYTLIKHHEWLQYVNTARDKEGNIIPEQLEKRLQSVAYDLQQDNLFDMAMMFTHADLKAVKTDNTFHDTTIGKGRIDESGNPISYGDLADNYAVRIKNYVTELKKSQPLLPVTKIPTSSVMKQAITHINSDGSTNLKGVYVDNDGLVVLKYNEVEDWEALGFPEGSISKGISAKGLNNKGEETAVDTGNIKFFVHGLDYANQLAKFDAFGLVDSDVLLSVSYAERPESKYRFFRTQGVILDVDTKYVHGGGNTDAGSGCGKSIADFKKRYIFGGERESDRLYISNMIKETTGMNDAEYVRFIKENENKPFTEIDPKDFREKIIKTFATINSNVRNGNREYNEMYASNPNVMGVFAYSQSNHVENVINFMQNESSRLDFLKKFALEREIPMIVFGD